MNANASSYDVDAYKPTTYEYKPRMWFLTLIVTAVLIILCIGMGLLGALSSYVVSANVVATHPLSSEPLKDRSPDNITIVDTEERRAYFMSVAEMTRGFVIGKHVTLPQADNGIDGYDENSRSHLRDVQRVIVDALWVILAASVVNIVVLLYALKARKLRGYTRGCLFAGAAVLAFGAVAAMAALLDFSALFAQFHGIFFASGTWTFPAESLLIQTFPLDFWVRELVIWVGISAFCAVICLILGLCTRKRVAKSGFSVN